MSGPGYVPEYVRLSTLIRQGASRLLHTLVPNPTFLQVVNFRKLVERGDKNIVICPILIHLILMAVQLGSRGATGEEIEISLRHAHLDRETLKRTAKALILVLKGRIYQFTPLCKIFVRSMHTINRNYRILALDVFSIFVELLNFRNPETAAEKINNWAQNNTVSTVNCFMPVRLLTNSCKVLIASTVYFTAGWHIEIDRKQTEMKIFHVDLHHSVKTEFMHTLAHYNYYESEDLRAKFLEVPLIKEEGSLVIILPNKIDDLPHVEKHIENVLTVNEKEFKREEIKAQVPKFVISTTLDWKNVLQELGVHRLFTENQAEISDIAGEPADLHVNHIIQKIIIRCVEDGVATNTIYFAQKDTPEPCATSKTAKDFIADHPFLFYVKLRGVILFIGRLLNPERSDEVV